MTHRKIEAEVISAFVSRDKGMLPALQWIAAATGNEIVMVMKIILTFGNRRVAR